MNFKFLIFNFKLLFVFIIILAAVLRLVGLDKYPAGLNADEAAIGYNAYSLLQTGKDEYGDPWPLSFKSFGDYKPGLYFYFVMPAVSLFGLNEWAVRIPSALFGIGTVILIFFLAKEIFKNKWIGIYSSLLLAISPWHIHFSRGGWETNVATFFITLGIFLFIKGTENTKLIWWSLLAFLTSMYTYQSPRLVVPILLLVLIILYKKNFVSMIRIIRKKTTWLSLAALIILSIPLTLQLIDTSATSRFSGLSIFSDLGPKSRVNELRGEHDSHTGIIAKLLHNKLTAYAPSFLSHYLDHFSGDFLFIDGDPLIRNKVPDAGQFYLIMAFFLLFGLTSLIKDRVPNAKLLLVWILIAPLASSLTYQTPHALRAHDMVIPLVLVTGYGLWVMGNWIKRFGRNTFLFFVTIVMVVTIFEFGHYLESYYIHYPKRYPLSWEYGFSEMVSKLNNLEAKYDNVVITDRYDQPYILVLFYKKYDPNKYQPQAILSPRDKFNFGTVRSFDKYQFHYIKPKEIEESKNTLFIGTPDEIYEGEKVIDRVYFPNGEVAFLFLGT